MKAQLARGESSSYIWGIRPEEGATRGLFWFCETENAGVVATEDEQARARRFQALSFGREGDDARAIVDMELIWAVAFMRIGKNPRSLMESLSGKFPWYPALDEAAAETGVEYQVDAYLSGVPLEHVLPDVRFGPERLVLDDPW